MRNFPRFSRMGWLVVAGVVGSTVCISLPTLSQDAQGEEVARNPSEMFQTWVGAPLPNVALPDHIPAPAGQVTLFADYAAIDETGIPLYLINRTKLPLRLSSQDGDPRIKLEGLREDGSWERAQAHRYSDCGNSYGFVTLAPGQFYKFQGYAAARGTKTRVRYSCYGSAHLLSNEGDGFVAADDLVQVRLDEMTLRSVPYPIAESLRQRDGLHRPEFTNSRKVAALRLLLTFEENLALKRDAKSFAAALTNSAAPGSEESRVAAVVTELVAGPWPAKRSERALFQRCVRALEDRGRESAAAFGMPENEPELVWEALAHLATREFLGSPKISDLSTRSDLPPNEWAPLVKKAVEAFQSGSATQKSGIFHLLSISPLVDEFVPSEVFETTLLSGNESMQRLCVQTLSRRNEWKRLVELGWKSAPKGQLMVLSALARPQGTEPDSYGDARAPHEPDEKRFWSHCVHAHPFEAADTLLSISQPIENARYQQILHGPLRDFLAGEAKQSESSDRDFELTQESRSMEKIVEALGEWGDAKDMAVLKRLLSYRGYRKMESWVGDNREYRVVHSFTIRAAARRALLARGIEVPQSVELKKDMTASRPPRKLNE